MSLLERRRATFDDWHDDPWDLPTAAEVEVVEVTRASRWPFKWLVALVALVAVGSLLAAGSVAWWYLHRINPSGEVSTPVNFSVEADDTLETISVRLLEQGFIVDDAVFRWYVERQGGLELTPGYFALRPLDHMGNIMQALATPPEQTFTSVTFPEGFTVAKMANRLADRIPRLLATDFLAAASDGSVRSEFQPEGVTSLEGLLFPDTYQVSNGESATQVAGRMVAMMERVGRQEDIVVNGYIQGLTSYQVLIVASMVEREAKVEEDRALIARVILNRLRRQMPLQIDATLYYQQDPDLPFTQLKVLDTPYNTYLYSGLPPTPIANPGRASIHAVLNPAPNPSEGGALCEGVAKDDCQYLYYVLADADGRHTFAVTLEQHEANVAKALADGLL